MSCAVCDGHPDRTLWEQVVLGAREYSRSIERMTGRAPSSVEVELDDELYVRLFAVAQERGLTVAVLVVDAGIERAIIPPAFLPACDIVVRRAPGSRQL